MKVASVQKAAFFVPELTIQVREQCEHQVCGLDCEGNNFILGHNITPSLSRGEPSHLDLPR